MPSTRKNICRTRPFPWSLHSVRDSPFKTLKNAKRALRKKPGQRGFTATSSLRSMGKIPRAGTNNKGCYIIGEKYKN